MRFVTGFGDALPWMLLAFVAAAVLALVLTPVVRRLVMRHGLIDRPEARRVNLVPIPRAGGLAVAAAFLLVAAVFLFLNEQQRWIRVPFQLSEGELAALLLGGAGAAALGALDDYLDLRARWQLLMQIGLAAFAVALGIGIEVINNPLGPGVIRFEGVLAAGFTMFWIVGMINSINWIDGLDGLSSGIALIAAVTLGAHQPDDAGRPAAHRGPVLRARRRAARLPALELLPGGRSSRARAASSSSATRSRSCRSSARPRSPWRCWSWACRSSTRSGSSSGAWPSGAHRSARTAPTSTTGMLDLGLSHRQTVLLIYGICIALGLLSLLLSGINQLYAFVGVFIVFGLILFVPARGSLRAEELEADAYENGGGASR